MAHSKWLKMDLHIHSQASNLTKDNDYDGCDLTYDALIKALTEENVNLFSITDHNTINIDLYKKLIENKDELIENNINFLIGVEIDISDKEIQEDVFHMLVFFDTNDLNKISNVLTENFRVESFGDINTKVEFSDLQHFFKCVFEQDIENVIAIPHFHDKHKGIRSDKIDKLAYTVFNALEDSNNRNKLIQSLKYYTQEKYDAVPITVFSDNHNISDYPLGKNGDNRNSTCMKILGSVKHPFNSVKVAFQDYETRICIQDVTKRDSNSSDKQYIKSIKCDDKVLELSEYQNTIIGGFGNGKSFLLNLILNGKNNVDPERYEDLARNYTEFNMQFSDGTTRNSLNELADVIEIILFNQYKEVYFSNEILEDSKDKLEKNLKITFPTLEKKVKPCFDGLISSYQKLEQQEKGKCNISDTINYDACSRRNEKNYSINIDGIEEIYIEKPKLNNIIQELEEESKKKILNRDIYSSLDKQHIKETVEIITRNNDLIRSISRKIFSSLQQIGVKSDTYNQRVLDGFAQISSNGDILKNIKKNLSEYSNNLFSLKGECDNFQKQFEKEKIENEWSVQMVEEFSNYQFIARYKILESYGDWTNIFKRDQNKGSDLFSTLIRHIQKKYSFAHNRTFKEQIERYVEKIYSNFSTISYDILHNDQSIIKCSAGEKANVIINIIFEKVKEYTRSGKSVIVILDQPEDNLDNKGITRELVNEIRCMKIDNLLPQIICVTHNPNIAITADSENIILATKNADRCNYESSSIEDQEFICKVCEVVEGGNDALKKRGIKFNIPMIKSLGRKEE